MCRSLQKESGCESFFLSYDSPAERSLSCKDLPPSAVEPVERDREDKGEDENNLLLLHSLHALGQEGNLGFPNPQTHGSSTAVLVAGGKNGPSFAPGQADRIHIICRPSYQATD